MNDNTLVAIRGYQGDAHQIEMMMPHHQKHGCPILVQSPDDSQIGYESFPGQKDLTCWSAGRRAYIGQLSLDRERLMLEQCLKFKQEFFLLHDADSICLKPELPSYLYKHTDTIFGQVVNDSIDGHKTFFDPPYVPEPWPHIAIQPPYFVHRSVIEKILSRPPVVAHPMLPFIDFLWVQFAIQGGIPYQRLEPCASCETTTPGGLETMHRLVRDNGVVFCHAIKSRQSLDSILHARQIYLARNRADGN